MLMMLAEMRCRTYWLKSQSLDLFSHNLETETLLNIIINEYLYCFNYGAYLFMDWLCSKAKLAILFMIEDESEDKVNLDPFQARLSC